MAPFYFSITAFSTLPKYSPSKTLEASHFSIFMASRQLCHHSSPLITGAPLIDNKSNLHSRTQLPVRYTRQQHPSLKSTFAHPLRTTQQQRLHAAYRTTCRTIQAQEILPSSENCCTFKVPVPIGEVL